MTDPFGAGASAAGFISLGLEVAKGLVWYVGAVQGRKDELEAVSRQVKDFNSSLDVIKNVSSSPARKHQLAGSKVQEALSAGMQDLKDLRQFLEKLKDDPTQGPGFKVKLKQTGKRMVFPFHRESLDRLQQQLQRANASLSLAIQALQV